ncbi:DUF397 domain-containing protein [Streptomyces sp. NPDC050085]|uniref:DUF397 domain-containing protein n=1 Tax=Streptomyces sp. NPDC050085 TaxID=3365600 RepID=UPI00379A077B
MSELQWLKSSYSGDGGNNCIELAATPTGELALRESDAPRQILVAAPASLSALLDTIKSGRLNNG